MRTRPFLSHKREDHSAVIDLKRVLAQYGIGGWRDLDDLELGILAQPGFEQAIDHETGGAIWYGTDRVLGSDYVNQVELPAIIARKRREPTYPLVPLFVNVTPSEAKKRLMSATRRKGAELTKADVELFMDTNGAARTEGQTYSAFRGEAARRYVRSAVTSLQRSEFTVAFAALAEPSGTDDFTFDWRELINPRTRELAPGAELIMRDSLETFRDAVRPTADFPELTLDAVVPLPMAALVGYEWRVTTHLKLIINQRSRSRRMAVKGDGPTVKELPEWEPQDLRGDGPVVLAVSAVPGDLREPLSHYASELGACRTLNLHMPGPLNAREIRALARYVAAALRDVNNTGHPKHLLLAGPQALAVLIGAASNGNGPTSMPFWNGSRYMSPLIIGDQVDA